MSLPPALYPPNFLAFQAAEWLNYLNEVLSSSYQTAAPTNFAAATNPGHGSMSLNHASSLNGLIAFILALCTRPNAGYYSRRSGGGGARRLLEGGAQVSTASKELIIGVKGAYGDNAISPAKKLFLGSQNANSADFTFVPFKFVEQSAPGTYKLQCAYGPFQDLYFGFTKFWTPENEDPGPYPMGMTSQYAAVTVMIEGDNKLYMTFMGVRNYLNPLGGSLTENSELTVVGPDQGHTWSLPPLP